MYFEFRCEEINKSFVMHHSVSLEQHDDNIYYLFLILMMQNLTKHNKLSLCLLLLLMVLFL